jgi:hypothetical protein
MVYGMRVFIGDSSMEFSEYEYVGLPPGFLTNIGMKKTVSTALSKPFSDCNSDPEYSQPGCIENCYSLSFPRYCNCSIQNCLTLEQIKCVHKFHDIFYHDLFPNDDCSKKCVASCERTVYELTTSSFVFPSENYATNIIDNRAYVFKNQNYSIDSDYLKKNLIALLVYWKNLEYTFIEETPTTTELNLIANVGGILGGQLILNFYSIYLIF